MSFQGYKYVTVSLNASVLKTWEHFLDKLKYWTSQDVADICKY